MRCYVNNALFDPRHLIYRDQGYGSDPQRPMLPYSLEVTDDELISVFSEEFSAFMSECKSDDAAFPDSDIPELKALSYPSLDEMLSSHRKLLGDLLKDFLYFQILDVLIGGNPRVDWRFVINEVVEISDEQNGYMLLGMGYPV